MRFEPGTSHTAVGRANHSATETVDVTWLCTAGGGGAAAAAASRHLLLSYHSSARRGSFQARDNISQFIGWCRATLAVPDTLLFETEDLVSRRNERNVLLCLLEV